jgi:hypothetical protein
MPQRPQTLAHCRVHVRAHRRPSVTSAPTHQVRVCEFMQPWPQHTRNSVPSPQGNLAILPNAAGLSGRSVCMQRYAAYAHSARSPWPRVPCVHAQHVPFIRGSSLSLVSAPTDCRHCHVRCHTTPAAGPSVYVVASTRGSLAHPAPRHRSSLAPDLTGARSQVLLALSDHLVYSRQVYNSCRPRCRPSAICLTEGECRFKG